MTIPAATYVQRRQVLIEDLSKGTLVLAAHSEVQAAHDMAYPFIQEAHFFYLTGISAPDWQLIIDSVQQKSWLVSPEVSETHQLFDGSMSHDEATQTSGIETVLSYAEGQQLIDSFASRQATIFTLGEDPHAQYYDFVLNPAPENLRRSLEERFGRVEDIRPLLAKRRAIKQLDERAIMQAAVDVTIDTFASVKTQLPNLTHEYQIEAEFNRAFRATGGEGHAYDPIVASGAHACTLHYGKNNDVLPENGLILLDIGARINGYAADITRTYALGVPTDRQKAVHTAVEKAHNEIIALIKPGASLKGYQSSVDEIMKQALRGLGLLDSLDDTETYRTYFPHAIGHGLGLDVHESLGGFETFQPGMVLTVEPGIYIPEEGIGVRIEDDILVTETGHENLSEKLPTSL